MADKCVVRNAQYRRGGLNKRERHNERKNADYQNEDIIKERADHNVHFKQAQGGYESTFDAMLADKTISTKWLGQDPFIVDELVFDVNTAYFENNGGYEYAKSFFEEAYRCAIEEIGGEQYVLSAVMHADERNHFANSTINNIIHNMTYMGVLRSGESRSQVIEALQIIPQEVFRKAQDIMDKRNSDAADARTYPMNTESRSLLNGKVYCMDCGSRLIITTADRFVIENGEKLRRLRYTCYGKYAKLTDCHGQTGYSATRLDNLLDGIIRHIFASMQSIPKNEVVTSSLVALKHEQEARYKVAQRDHAKAMKDVTELKAEVIKAIRGESKFTPELLSELISGAENELAENAVILNKAKRDLDECDSRIVELQEQFDEVISWTELYDAADLSAKKMIVANLIDRIEVGLDYQIHIDLNINLEHFGIQFDFCNFGKEQTA